MQIRFIFLMTALLTVQTVSGNQGTGQSELLSLEQAVATALEHHPRLRQVQLEIQAAAARIKEARSTFLPQVDAGGIAKQGLSGAGNWFGLHGLASSPEPEDIAVSVNVYQDLYDFGRTEHQSSARRSELIYFTETVLAEQAKVILDAKNAYYNGLKAQKLVGVAETTIQERRLTLRQAEAFYRAQLRSKLDVSLAQLEVSRAELGRVKADNSLKQAFATLNHRMGVDSSQIYTLQEPLIEPTSLSAVEGLVEQSLDSRPDLRAVEARIEAAQEWVKRAESERYPRFMGLFSGGWTRFADFTLSNLLFGGFGFRLPVFTGGRLTARIEEAKKDVEKTKMVREELIQNVELQVRTAYTDILTAIEAVKTNSQMIQQAQEALRLARIRYRMELSDFVELAAAQTFLSTAESDYAAALYDYKIKESELEYATGGF